MNRTARTITTAAFGLAVLFGATACGSTQHVPSASDPQPTASAPATTAAPATMPAIPSGADIKRADMDVQQSAASFVNQTLVDPAVLNAGSPANTLPALSGAMTNELANTVSTESADQSKWNTLYNDVAPFAFTQKVTKGQATITAATVTKSDANGADVHVTATAVWTLADGTQANVSRTVDLHLVPSPLTTGPAFLVDGAKGSTTISKA